MYAVATGVPTEGTVMPTDTHTAKNDPDETTDELDALVHTDVATVDFEAHLHHYLRQNRDKNSHVELDPSVFHVSTLGYPIRQIYLGKLGLKEHTPETLATFQVGTMIHEYLEEVLADSGLETEMRVEGQAGDVKLVGRCDAYDPDQSVVYDFKSRAGWYKFDPPTQRHIDQLLGYMYCTGANYGRVIYVNKANMEMRPWPEDGVFEFDSDRWRELVPKLHRVRQVILDRGVAMREEQIPFEKGTDWLSRQEKLPEWME